MVLSELVSVFSEDGAIVRAKVHRFTQSHSTAKTVGSSFLLLLFRQQVLGNGGTYVVALLKDDLL